MESEKIVKLVEYWEKASEIDFQTASDIYEKTKNYVTVLFYLHLSLEKIIKALYVSEKKTHSPFSHNLIYLLKETGIDISDREIRLLTDVNEFNIECRYPDDKFMIYKKAGKLFTKKYLREVEKFRLWISEILKKKL